MIPLLILTTALAESTSLLPAGSTTVYAGVGASSFQYGSSGLIRDRVWFARLDTYAAVGVADRLQISAWAPVVRAWVHENPDRGPCPGTGDYCDTIVTIGDAGVEARYGVVHGTAALSLAVHSNAWNRATRHRFDAVGYGETGVAARAIGGIERSPGAWTVRGVAYAGVDLVVNERIDRGEASVRAPLHALSGGLEAAVARGPITGQVAVHSLFKLGGLPFGPTWVSQYHLTDEAWIALRYQVIRAELKLSWSLPGNMGIHLAAGRAAWTRGGPRDLTDLSVGVHRWFP